MLSPFFVSRTHYNRFWGVWRGVWGVLWAVSVDRLLPEAENVAKITKKEERVTHDGKA
jgi:hypothetical protein